MSGMYGADVAQLRAAANQFARMAEQLDVSRMTVGNAIQVSAWVGPFATSFRYQWDSVYSQQVHSAATLLKNGADRLRANADAQERVSAVVTASGITPKACVESLRLPQVSIHNTAYGSDVTVKDTWGDKYGGTWTTEQHARDGLQTDHHADAGFNEETGRYEANAGASAQYGWEVSQSATYENGVASAEFTQDGFAGARAEAEGSASVGVDGAQAHVGGSAFVGAEENVSASVDVGGVEGGVKAGVMGGVGVEASADAEVSYDEISLDVKVGASLGIGLSFEPSISIKPKEIMHNAFGWLGF